MKSLRNAINKKCFDCCYDSADRGGRKQQVAACASYDCPVHGFRPVPRKPLPARLLDHWRLKKQPPGGQR